MRILLLADIHANWPALQAINEPHDVCVVLGDLVDYGLEPAPCIQWVREHATHAIRGNHDHGAAQRVRVTGKVGFRYLTAVTRPVTLEKLTSDDRRYLATLPVARSLTLDGMRYLLVHATPQNVLNEYGPPEAAFWASRLDGVDAEVICVGHSHQAFVLPVGDKLVINPGSIGLPRDSDPRASYAVIENRRVEIKRIEYPVENTVRIIQESPLPDVAKEMLAETLRSGGAKKEAANWG